MNSNRANKVSQFRIWLNKIWQEHKSEVENYAGSTVDYSLEDYVRRYKWWLKAVYKHERSQHD